MNFVLNVKADAKPVAQVDVRLRSKFNIGGTDNADVHYVEFRHDPESGRNFVCLVYRLPDVS